MEDGGPVSGAKRKTADDLDEEPSKRAKVEASPAVERMVFCQGLPWSADEYSITDFFAECGGVESVELPLAADGRSSGTAFVTFTTEEATEAGLAMNGETFPGSNRWIKIIKGAYGKEQTEAKERENTEQTSSIFVGNLAWEVTEDAIREAFQECGDIYSVRFAQDRESGEFRGFGHIDFDSPESASRAVALAGTDVAGRPIRCDFAAAKKSFGGGGGGYGNGGRGRGGGGKGRGGGRCKGGGTPTLKKAAGSIPRGGATNKKITF